MDWHCKDGIEQFQPFLSTSDFIYHSWHGLDGKVLYNFLIIVMTTIGFGCIDMASIIGGGGGGVMVGLSLHLGLDLGCLLICDRLIVLLGVGGV